MDAEATRREGSNLPDSKEPGSSKLCFLMSDTLPTLESARPLDFIREIVADDLKAGRHGRAHTRFPPEPNGICTSGTPSRSASTSASPSEFGGICNLRFDDTNPTKEDVEYVESIQEDVRWLGFDWERAAVLRVRLLRAAVRVRRAADRDGRPTSTA
jgi:hypothetical protein